MPNYFREADETQIVGGGYGGYGGGGFGGGGFGSCFALIILVVIVLWLLFSRDGKDGCGNNGNYGGGYGMPYPIYPPFAPYGGGGNCCSPLDCKIPMTPDMSNCEIDRDIWKVDADLLKCCCEEKEVTHMEAEATRALINANTMQDLRDKLACAAADKAALESKYYTEKKFGDIEALLCKYDNQNDKQYYGLSRQIESIKCDLDCFPKLPPVYFEGITPNTHHTDCHDFPRRKNCCDNDCGCN